MKTRLSRGRSRESGESEAIGAIQVVFCGTTI